MFYDSPLYEVGDILYIIVNESTDVDNHESRSLKKDSKTGTSFDVSGKSDGGFADQEASASLDANTETDREFDGDAQFTSEQGFTDRITVTVRELLPNGNVLVAGERRVMVDGDERALLISGLVRRQDVKPDGTISSRMVANLRMRYPGRGENQAFVRQGWLARRFNKLWPW
jgi:flagellar L-ring protein precursor FlgH